MVYIKNFFAINTQTREYLFDFSTLHECTSKHFVQNSFRTHTISATCLSLYAKRKKKPKNIHGERRMMKKNEYRRIHENRAVKLINIHQLNAVVSVCWFYGRVDDRMYHRFRVPFSTRFCVPSMPVAISYTHSFFHRYGYRCRS